MVHRGGWDTPFPESAFPLRRLNWCEAVSFFTAIVQRAVEPSHKSLTAVASAMSDTSWNPRNAAMLPCHWSNALSLASSVHLEDVNPGMSWQLCLVSVQILEGSYYQIQSEKGRAEH